MNSAVESYPPRASEAAVGAAQDASTLNPSRLLGTAARLFGHAATVTRAGTRLAGELAKVVVGRSESEAERRDWRFQDRTWTGNPGHHRLMQGYLAASGALAEGAEEADISDWRQRERARFVVTMLTSAMSPTNTLLGNPAALTVALETGGGSLVAGPRNFVSDLRHNGGLPVQVDRSQFVVGKDLAVTPSAVVLRKKKPAPFDILAWNAGETNLPAALHGQFLDMFASNALTQTGGMTVLGSPVDLGRVKVDADTTDHITPWRGCYASSQLLGGQTTFAPANTGHIQTLICPPGNPRSRYWIGGEPDSDPDAWKATAEERTGSWWEHWAEWVVSRSGDQKPAPIEPGSAAHPALGAAPGDYVLVQA